MGTLELRDIIDGYVKKADDKVLRIVKAVFESYQKEEEDIDSYDELPQAVKDILEESIAQADRGEVTPRIEVMAEVRKKYNVPG